MSSETMQRFQAAAETIRQRVGEAEIGVILGSGLGDYVDALQDAKYIDYKDIPGFPVSTAPGHAGRWWTGTLHGQRVCMMQGRFHYYEGYDLQDVTMPVRVMALLGVKTLVVTNAAGGVNLNFAQGCLMMLTDFINMSGHNPLTGKNLAEFGTRFPDMTHAYDVQLMEKCRQAAKALGIPLQEGVYMWMNGPTYETPAEIRMARILGADGAIGSTFNFPLPLFNQIEAAYSALDIPKAQALQKRANNIMQALVSCSLFPSIKHILKTQGVDCGGCRKPFPTLTEAQKAHIERVVKENM